MVIRDVRRNKNMRQVLRLKLGVTVCMLAEYTYTAGLPNEHGAPLPKYGCVAECGAVGPSHAPMTGTSGRKGGTSSPLNILR